MCRSALRATWVSMLRLVARALGAPGRLRRAYALARARRASPPTVAVVLGGDAWREEAAARLLACSTAPSSAIAFALGGGGAAGDAALLDLLLRVDWAALPVLLSSCHGGAREQVFVPAGVAAARLRVDERPIDTVTNVTRAAEALAAAPHTHAVLLTSPAHAPRAAAAARLALGAVGVAASVAAVRHEGDGGGGGDSFAQPEGTLRRWRDAARAAAWALAGYDGATVAAAVHPGRARGGRAAAAAWAREGTAAGGGGGSAAAVAWPLGGAPAGAG